MSTDRIERYLIKLSITYEKVSEDVWVINDRDKGLNQIVLYVDETLLTVRSRVLALSSVSDEKLGELFRELLLLNCELLHGAYAIEDDYIIIMDTLELATMDLEELQASLDAIGLALAEHHSRIRGLVFPPEGV